jgi:hypothetical protein
VRAGIEDAIQEGMMGCGWSADVNDILSRQIQHPIEVGLPEWHTRTERSLPREIGTTVTHRDDSHETA